MFLQVIFTIKPKHTRNFDNSAQNSDELKIYRLKALDVNKH